MSDAMASETRRRFGGMTVALSAKVAPEERDMVDYMVALEREKGGELAELTNAGFLRRLILEAGERVGVTPAQFREPGQKPKAPPVAPKPAYAGPSAEAVRAALERLVDAGVPVVRVAEASGVSNKALSILRSKGTIQNPTKHLPRIAAALGHLGYPVG